MRPPAPVIETPDVRSVSAEVLALVVRAAAMLAKRGHPVDAHRLYIATYSRGGEEVAEIVREHLVAAGLLEPRA